jgi:hypothetical protein
MLKSIRWERDAVFSLRLREDLYSLCQMRQASIMQFFVICSPRGTWASVDLNEHRTLATLFVAESRLKPLFVEKLGPERVVPSKEPVSRIMLNATIGGGARYGADLVELNENYSMIAERVVKLGLDPATDIDVIRRFELTGMVGSAEKIRARLVRYFDSGVNWDDQKSFLFKGIELPPPDPKWTPCDGRDA